MKVIQFPNKPAFHSFLNELREAYDDNRLKDFVCVYNYDYEKGKERKGFIHGINSYWFGKESTVYLLGLIDVMKEEILKYMARKTEEYKMEV